MCKFKFGAMVTTKAHGVGVVVNYNSDEKECFVLLEGSALPCWFEEDEVNPVPHPDTVRLDFLIKNGAYVEPPNNVHDFYISRACACYGKPYRVRAVLDMVIDKKTKG